MSIDCILNIDLSEIGFSYIFLLISGKYKMIIFYCFVEFEVVRYNVLKCYINIIFYKILSLLLKELEVDNLIICIEYF